MKKLLLSSLLAVSALSVVAQAEEATSCNYNGIPCSEDVKRLAELTLAPVVEGAAVETVTVPADEEVKADSSNVSEGASVTTKEYQVKFSDDVPLLSVIDKTGGLVTVQTDKYFAERHSSSGVNRAYWIEINGKEVVDNRFGDTFYMCNSLSLTFGFTDATHIQILEVDDETVLENKLNSYLVDLTFEGGQRSYPATTLYGRQVDFFEGIPYGCCLSALIIPAGAKVIPGNCLSVETRYDGGKIVGGNEKDDGSSDSES